MGIEYVLTSIDKVISHLRPPSFELPPILLWCTNIKKDGTSSIRAAANAINGLRNAGFDMGPNKDGTQNKLGQYTYILTSSMMKEMKEHAVIDATLPPGGIIINATGGNAGGPVTVVGSNTNWLRIKGGFQ